MQSSPISGVTPPSTPIDGLTGPRPRTAPAAPADPARDQVEVSGAGRDLARAEAAVERAGDLRLDVVSRLRAAVKAGTYRVDPHAVARAMVERGERA